MRVRMVLGLAVMVAVAVLFQGQASVRANGVPQLVKLTYLEGVSNWGPTEGEGVLEFSFAEAYAKVDVKNLAPQDGFAYDGWLAGGDAAPFRVGEIPVDGSGIGTLQTRLTDLDSYNYNLFVIAAREAGAAPGETLPAQRSIAGRFTIISDESSTADGDSTPNLLPDTGERAATGSSTTARTVFAGAVMVVVAAIIIAVRRMRAKGATR